LGFIDKIIKLLDTNVILVSKVVTLLPSFYPLLLDDHKNKITKKINSLIVKDKELKKVITYLKQNIESFEKWKSEHYDKASIDTEIVEIIENDGLKFQEENKLKEQHSNKSLFDEKRLEESKKFLRRVSNGLAFCSNNSLPQVKVFSCLI
jgi:hypothetical protein